MSKFIRHLALRARGNLWTVVASYCCRCFILSAWIVKRPLVLINVRPVEHTIAQFNWPWPKLS